MVTTGFSRVHVALYNNVGTTVAYSGCRELARARSMETDVETTEDNTFYVKSYAAGLRVRNLFDNSDWSNPIAQARLAGVHGNKTYIVDRWPGEGYLTSVAKKSNGISFSTSGFLYVYQKVEGVGGKTLTFAYKTSKTTQTQLAVYDDTLSNQIIVESVTPVDGIGLITVNVPAENDTAAFIIYPENEEIIEWLALYEGEYTAETLPPYVPKGYAVELAECSRYYYIMIAEDSMYNVVLNGMITNASKDCVVAIPVNSMRITPSAIFTGKMIIRGVSGYINNSSAGIGVNVRISGGSRINNGACAAIATMEDGGNFSGNVVNNTPIQINFVVGSKLELSADL